MKNSSLYMSIPHFAEFLTMKRVWQSVVLLAFQDALSSSAKRARTRDRHRAAKWLLKNHLDFRFVCLNAGYDPRAIRNRAFRLISSDIISLINCD
jgi:hypothetical protein